MTSSDAIAAYYDEFAATFVRDYLLGNERVARQLDLLRAAVPADARAVLVAGCGGGESVRLVARLLDRARVLGVDLSRSAIELARRLHPEPNAEYRVADVLRDPLGDGWDVVVLPDVYEHIPREHRAELHARLAAATTPTARFVLTIPSPQKARLLARADAQIVDEVVSAGDLVQFANDVGGELIYLRSISVWEPNDYVHAVVARGLDAEIRIEPNLREGLSRAARRLSSVRYVRGVRRRLRQRRLDRVL